MNGLLQTLRGFGPLKLGLMIVVGLAMIGGFTFVAMRISSPALAPLYSELSPEDSAKIVTELGKLGVPFDTANNGGQILVPSERVLRLRMTMAELGLPASGSVVGYEVFDRSETFGSSNFVMNINMVRALEGELGRTITSFNQIESARVHLVVPKRELFAKDRQEPSASVALKLRGGQELNKGEIAAITHFVAAGVPGLRSSRVTVVDSYGRLLARGDGAEGSGAVAAASEEYRVSFENRTRDTLETLLEKVVGLGKVKVQVAADINFDRVERNSEKFDPEGQVARSVQSSSSLDDEKDGQSGGAVTVANQQPGGAAGGTGAMNNQRKGEKTEETTNFEISKTVERHVKEGGTVNRLSIAVLVDGTYEGEGEQKTYKPRPDDELKRLESLIKSAVVFDEKRGDTVQVVNLPFTEIKTTEDTEGSFLSNFKHEFEGIVQTLIIAGVAVLAIMVVLRPAIKHLMKMTADAAQAAEAMAALGGPGGVANQQVIMRLGGAAGGMPGGPAGAAGTTILQMGRAGGGGGGGSDTTIVEEEEDDMVDLENIKGKVKSSSLRKVQDFVEKNPDETLNVMRQWMIKEVNAG